MLRGVSLEEELHDVPEYQGVLIEEWATCLFHKRVNHYSARTLACVSYVNWEWSSVPQEDILACKSKGSVHTPFGLCGVTAGSTVAVAFEPARPGESVEAHAVTDDAKVVAWDPCVSILCGFLEACDHC